MSSRSADLSPRRIGILGTWLTIVGTVHSGPLALGVTSLVQAQPAWSDAATYVSHYHWIQTLPFFFGVLLISGSILMIGAVYALGSRPLPEILALVFTAIGAGFIFFNYASQATLVPALVRNYRPALEPVLSLFAVNNPTSIFWAVEMWCYGFLGAGTWLAAGFFGREGLQRVARYLFMANGVVSIAGALWTAVRMEWVLSTPGLAAYAGWNLLYVALAVVLLLVLRREAPRPAAA